MLNQKLYTVADVAELTGMTERTIRNYLKDGRLHGRKIGVQWRFTEEDIQELFLETQAIEARIRTPEELVTFFLNAQRTKGDFACLIYDLSFPDAAVCRECVRWIESYPADNVQRQTVRMVYSIGENGDTVRIAMQGARADVHAVQQEFMVRNEWNDTEYSL